MSDNTGATTRAAGSAASMRLTGWLRWTGILLLVAGLQAWGFHRSIEPQVAAARAQLAALQQEVPDNRLMNLALQALQDYWRLADDEVVKSQVLELRDNVLQRFNAEPAVAVEDFARVSRTFAARTPGSQEALALLQERVERLAGMYEDHYAKALAAYTSPAWYWLPTAAILNRDSDRSNSLAYNDALYRVLVRDIDGGIGMLDELRRTAGTPAFESDVLFALARTRYAAFEQQKDPAFLREALQYAQQSVRTEAGTPMHQLFLEFLLAIDQEAAKVEMDPMQGEGSGEGEGQRGTIATDTGEF